MRAKKVALVKLKLNQIADLALLYHSCWQLQLFIHLNYEPLVCVDWIYGFFESSRPLKTITKKVNL